MSVGPYQRVIDALNGHGVRYAVAGGVAVVLHGLPRFTADLDLILDLHPDNVEAACRAFEALGMHPRPPVDPRGLGDAAVRRGWIEEKGLVAFTFAHPSEPLCEVDVLLAVPLDYAAVERGIVYFDVGGTTLPVVSRRDLVVLKRAAARPKDHEDLTHLEAEGCDG